MSPNSVMRRSVGYRGPAPRLQAQVGRPVAARRARPAAAAAASAAASPPPIDLIITDVDGTLLNSAQELTPGVEAAVAAAAAAGVPLVIATGKAVGPWTHRILPRLPTRMPQIFIQGLLIRDLEEGTIYQRLLQEALLHDAIDFAEAHGLTLAAYCGDRIVCAATDAHTDRFLHYGEPTPEALGSLRPHVGRLPLSKVIFMADQATIEGIRPAAEAAFGGRAQLTTALSGMLEVLPPGASKGAGVEWLLERLGVDPGRCMALGDGENDVEMLRLVGWGVAMGNAGAAARGAADAVTASNDEDGVARAIEDYVLRPRGLTLEAAGVAAAAAQT